MRKEEYSGTELAVMITQWIVIIISIVYVMYKIAHP